MFGLLIALVSVMGSKTTVKSNTSNNMEEEEQPIQGSYFMENWTEERQQRVLKTVLNGDEDDFDEVRLSLNIYLDV